MAIDADGETIYEIENKSIKRCQCIMRHWDLKEGAIWQCGASRCDNSNLFCEDCERTHGDYFRKLHPEAS